MNWLRIDDRFEDHDKVEPLSDPAHRLWMRAACWCKQPERSDHVRCNGFVPRGMLGKISKNKLPVKRLETLAGELVAADGGGQHEFGLWRCVVVEGELTGWFFHDWDRYQQPGDERPRDDTPSGKSEAGRLGGLRSAEARRSRHGSAQPSKQNPEAPRSTAEAEPRSRPKQVSEAPPKQPSKQNPEAPRSTAEAPISRIPDPGPISNPSPPVGLDPDLTGSARERPPFTGWRAGVVERKPEQPGGKPLPRHDPSGTRFGFTTWWPSQAVLDWSRATLGLTDQDFDETMVECRDKLHGLHDIGWFDLKVGRFLETTAERKRLRGRPRGAPLAAGQDPVARELDDWLNELDQAAQEAS